MDYLAVHGESPLQFHKIHNLSIAMKELQPHSCPYLPRPLQDLGNQDQIHLLEAQVNDKVPRAWKEKT
ncbi:MAG: hypothetical protein BEU03_00915 [Marine Group III euryarchaeote CG-Epi6]|uniref:Uncharacterized protein n=1 Tax=Marine Group III euryarchaeote CG-Epi6 TaxID=1889000 RepID=A0A1J5SPX4_9ARCH|nr:MAG: hypothetical protein BEU03_00915 [Marine Group III euryarchaeote CG-Epi6]